MMTQSYLDFTLYPDVPGANHQDTSEAAADSMRQSAASLRARALLLLNTVALTADEVATTMGESILAIRPRITELLKLKLIRDTGVRRPNASGRMAIVWERTEQ